MIAGDVKAVPTVIVDGSRSLVGGLTEAKILEALAERSAGQGDADLALHAEARQLTLPGMMGERFQVMGLGRNLGGMMERAPRGFSLQDLRYRL